MSSQAPESRLPGAALQAARLRLQGTHAALAAALLGEPVGSATDEDTAAARPRERQRLPLVVQLAENAIAPWAEQRPWTLMALAAGAGALLVSPRGRRVLGSLVASILVAPAPGRRGWQVLGQGLSLLTRNRPGRSR
jgi:hypothetical protein